MGHKWKTPARSHRSLAGQDWAGLQKPNSDSTAAFPALPAPQGATWSAR